MFLKPEIVSENSRQQSLEEATGNTPVSWPRSQSTF